MFNIYKKQKKYEEENVLQARDIVDNTSAIIHMDTFEKQKHLDFYCLYHKKIKYLNILISIGIHFVNM